MQASKHSTPNDIKTYFEPFEPTDYKWTSFGLYQSPEQDKRNFDPNYELQK